MAVIILILITIIVLAAAVVDEKQGEFGRRLKCDLVCVVNHANTARWLVCATARESRSDSHLVSERRLPLARVRYNSQRDR